MTGSKWCYQPNELFYQETPFNETNLLTFTFMSFMVFYLNDWQLIVVDGLTYNCSSDSLDSPF